EDAHLIPTGELVMRGDEMPATGDVQATAAARDLDGLTDEREGHRVAIRLEADKVVLGDESRLAGLEAKAGLAPVAISWWRSSVNRSAGRSWVVPWIRTSAISACHWPSCSRKSCSSTNVRPGRKLRLKYFTPDSTLPLVWAR